ncbi:MAG: ATPase, T2SS/T4P/T4SS family [Deltaproteobacteria bacterium]|nr:ATPase, T2SS/T4P/T4SS family [Deltaproteobacteria bacterium]
MNTPDTNKHPLSQKKKLGEYLVKGGLIDEETLTKALELQKTQKRRLGQVLVDMGVADEIIIAKTLAKQMKIPYGRLKGQQIAKRVIDLVSPELAENHLVIPIKKREKSLLVAMADPLDLHAVNDLRFFTQLPIDVAVAPVSDILDAIERHYPKEDLKRHLDTGPSVDGDIEIVRQKDPDEKEAHELLVLTEMPPIVRFTNSILADAIKMKASDIHIEPQKTSILIRYRVDGVLREIMRAEKHIHAGVVSRIKIISNLDIAIKRKPQDGKAQVKQGGKTYDLRVSTLPTSYGEKVTIRILDPVTAALNPEDLGFSDKDLKKLLNAIKRPQGIILVTGPTGSGKSSTLYACLNRLKAPEVNIVTVEDPVEFDVAGINQVQINPASGIDFAAGLRSILRQDPDIVMVGEIRDSETAVTAFQAAQTGHLVLSTLHTNDAPSAVIRLMDLGIDPFLISASLVAVLGQRLVRKICPECNTLESISGEQMEAIRPYIPSGTEVTFWKGAGCETCQFSGYLGRMGLFEVLMLTPALQRLISPGLSAVRLKEAAENEGFQIMAADGIAKAIQGLTTVDEVFRAAPPEAKRRKSAKHHEESQEEGEEEPESEAPYFSEPSAAVSSATPKRILVVDDSAVIRKAVSHQLEAEGYLVITASDGLEALKTASKEKPDLILLDYLMPKMDGLAAMKKLKSQLATRFIPIIMLTAKDEIESEVEAIQSGADDYLTKPFSPKRLQARIDRLLKR